MMVVFKIMDSVDGNPLYLTWDDLHTFTDEMASLAKAVDEPFKDIYTFSAMAMTTEQFKELPKFTGF